MLPSQPNILIYHSHDTGRWIGPYGHAKNFTPNANRFAKEAIVFDQAFAVSPTCSPSRAAMMTGRYPHNNGVMGLCHKRFAFDLNDGERHAADYFNGLGYRTVGIGVVHEVRDPAKAPYQTRIVDNNALHAGSSLEKVLLDKPQNKPFFISIGTSQTHRPYPPLAETAQSQSDLPSFIPDTTETRHDFAPLEASVQQWDCGLGDVLETLKRHDLEDNTLVVVTGDHGLAMPRSKGTLYDSGTGIMMMMRWPGHITPNTRCEQLVSNLDLLPTWFEVADVDIPSNLQGKSLMPLLHNKSLDRQYLFNEHTYHGYYTPMRSVRSERYKYILNFFTGAHIQTPGDVCKGGAWQSWFDNTPTALSPLHELYDLKNDPEEEHDLLIEPTSDSLKIMETMRKELYRWMQQTQDPLLDGPIPNPGWKQAREWLEKG